MSAISEEQYNAAIAQREAAEKVINAYHEQAAERFDARWKRFDKENEFFTEDELVYSSHVRCKKCNAGLAYPKMCGPQHQWTCSNVLKGIGTDVGHDCFPFAFYEIKSENQPSANGATTRPGKS